MEIGEIDKKELTDLKYQLGTSSVINKAMNQITIPAFKKYPAYKDSGVEWLGEIPEHWEVRRFKSIFSEINERSINGTEDLLSVSQYTGVTKKSDKTKDGDLLTTALTLEGYKKVYKNDLVSNIMLAWNGSLGFSPHNGITSPAYSVYRLKIKSSAHYFHYLVRSEIYKSEFKRNSSGIIESRLRLYTDDFYRIMSILPPLQEQVAIATFLNNKTVKIDHVIAQKEKMITLLKERKQIIIQDLVTGKKVWNDTLNTWTEPDEVKDSGVEWIGEIPVDWDVKRLKYLLNELNVKSETGKEELLSLSKYKGVIPKSALEERAGGAESLVGYKVVKENHLVINKMQAVNGLIAVSKLKGITSPDYSVYFVQEESKLNADFLCYLILQPQYLGEFRRRVTGVMEGFIRLYTDDFYNVCISLPPIQEQTTIVSNIEAQSTNIDKAIALQEQQISKLKELKSTLIDSAVTGKIKVV